MKRQSMNARLDESLGERRGPERDMKQSYKDRRDESRGARRERSGSSGKFDLKDNMQAGMVKKINTNSEQYDMGRIKKYSCGTKGYPAEAWNYKY